LSKLTNLSKELKPITTEKGKEIFSFFKKQENNFRKVSKLPLQNLPIQSPRNQSRSYKKKEKQTNLDKFKKGFKAFTSNQKAQSKAQGIEPIPTKEREKMT
jgi:hypothetical protein